MILAETVRKRDRALQILGALDGAVVAFSGGVDSTLLLKLAVQALGERCVALTAVSPSLSAREREEARKLAGSLGVRHVWADSRELDREGFRSNPTHRCYFCKSELFDLCFADAAARGFGAVVYGATADDVGDHRPGMVAARERGARAPLLEAGLGKEEIRALSREAGLPTHDKPAMACLSSRFPYGTAITEERLGRVEAAEEVLRSRGFRDVRVRFHDDVARIEVGAPEWNRLADPELRATIAREIRGTGFRFVSLDLEGFASGRMNRPAAVSPASDEAWSGTGG